MSNKRRVMIQMTPTSNIRNRSIIDANLVTDETFAASDVVMVFDHVQSRTKRIHASQISKSAHWLLYGGKRMEILKCDIDERSRHSTDERSDLADDAPQNQDD